MEFIKISEEDFNVQEELWQLRKHYKDVGVAVSFIGYVRDLNDIEVENHFAEVEKLYIEYYSGMTEKILENIRLKAVKRWGLIACKIIHRVGTLFPQEQIVLVITLARHREDAFDSVKFVMDFLKSKAPFWKKEFNGEKQKWVEYKLSDKLALDRWKDYLD